MLRTFIAVAGGVFIGGALLELANLGLVSYVAVKAADAVDWDEVARKVKDFRAAQAAEEAGAGKAQ